MKLSFQDYQKAYSKIAVDVVLGGQWGDEGKGKKTNDASQKNSYSLCGRFNGGPNAGHTIYLQVDGHRVKVVTHHIPTGFAAVSDQKDGTKSDGIESLIGGGCVVALTGARSLGHELNDVLTKIKRPSQYATKLLKVAYNAHVITDDHLEKDSQDKVIGTTGSGIGPTYAAKAERTTATRIEDVMIQEYPGDDQPPIGPSHRGWLVLKSADDLVIEVVDPAEFVVERASRSETQYQVLLEAGQGYKLDIDWAKKYPYNTSSGCGTPSAMNFGIPKDCFRNITVVFKLYETYVGDWDGYSPTNQTKNDLQMLGVLGCEFGATTGRPRLTNWFNLKDYVQCCWIWSANSVLVNKCDIVENHLNGDNPAILDHPEINWKAPRKLHYYDMDDQLQEANDTDHLIDIIREHTPQTVQEICFSYSPDHI